MKKEAAILFFIVSLGVFSQSQSQNGNAYYHKKAVINDSLVRNSNKIDINTKDIFYNSINEVERFEYVLRFNKSEAIFEEVLKLKDDSEKSLKVKMAKAIIGFNGLIYYNSQSEIKIHQMDFSGTNFLIKSKKEDIKWTLFNEKLTIGSYICFKAQTTIMEEGRNGLMSKKIVAWYNPEININFGPDGFWGLPGLIVQLETENIVTTLKNIKFIYNETEIIKPISGKEVTKVEFDNIIKDLVLNREKYYDRD